MWKEIKRRKVRTFQIDDEPLLIHIIKTGFEDKYIVVYEDAHEQCLGDIVIGTQKDIKETFGIDIEQI
jgi:restriction endonuclease